MTKQEAIFTATSGLNNAVKINHISWGVDEWVTISKSHVVTTESGENISFTEFMALNEWEAADGWRVSKS